MTKELNEQIEEETKGFIAKIGEILGSTKSDKEKDDEKDDGSKKQPDFVTAADFDDFKRLSRFTIWISMNLTHKILKDLK